MKYAHAIDRHCLTWGGLDGAIILFQVYVEYVVKNPECQLGRPITSELFREQLNSFIAKCSLAK